MESDRRLHRSAVMDTRKIAVITGASAGLGRACVQAFARAGFDIGVVARGAAGLEGALRDVQAGKVPDEVIRNTKGW